MNIADPTRTESWISGCNRWLDSWRGRLLLGSAIAAVYLYAYWTHPALPGADSAHPLGWWGWWDQGQYLKCAAGLSRGSLTSDTYWYPLGYPLLGAFFYRLMPQHFFLIPNLTLVVGTALLFYEIARKFISSLEAILLLVIFAVCYRGTATISVVEPWNTIPTHFLSYLVILVVALREPNRSTCLFGALCVGLIYLFRPPDAACLGLILPFAILRLPRWRDRVVTGAIAVLGLFVFVATVLLINRSIFGSWRTPYEVISANIGFASYPFGQKLFSLVVDGRPIFQLDDSALLLHFPWLILLPPGIVYFIRRRKWNAIVVLASLTATYFLYFAYNDFGPGNVFRYHLIHYLFWTLPLLALITYLGFREAWKDRIGRWSFALIPLLLLPVCFITLKENVRGAVSPGSSPGLRIPPEGQSRLDWIFVRGESISNPFQPEFDLQPFKDFLRIGRDQGDLLVLARRARNRPIEIRTGSSSGSGDFVYGTLEWQLRTRPYPLRIPDARRPLDILWRGTADNIDVTGPSGVPDGRADQVIDVALERALQLRVSAWDIETIDKRGHWLSNKNPHGLWLIKVEFLPMTEGLANQAHVRLIFPDYGDFERASSFVLRATDINGILVIDQTINK
jgi:hypothetical protein